MTFTLLDPPLPSVTRFRHLRSYGAHMTMLRRMQLDCLAQVSATGVMLDFGGGQSTNYTRYLPNGLDLRSVNISNEFQPTDLVKPGDPIPYADAHFDSVMTFNVLEHIYEDVAAMTDLTRVLKPGGVLHISVPWIYPVHGHPDDFHRHAPNWWAITLATLGYANVTLLPLVFGRRTSALTVQGRGDKVIRGIVESKAALRDILSARLRFRKSDAYTGRRGETVWSSAPGWYIRAVKAS